MWQHNPLRSLYGSHVQRVTDAQWPYPRARSLQLHLLCGDAFFHLRCPWPTCTLGLLWTKEILFISLLSFPSAIPLTGPQGLHSISSPLVPFLILRASALQHPENIWSMAVFLSSLLTFSNLLSLPLKKKKNNLSSPVLLLESVVQSCGWELKCYSLTRSNPSIATYQCSNFRQVG